jgi:diguanylate cyclase (GGDEF)-like protein/PAS domain S-box-containing protein
MSQSFAARLRNLLHLSRFDPQEGSRVGYLLPVILGLSFALSLLLGALFYPGQAQAVTWLVLLVVFWVAELAAWWLLERGQPEWASLTYLCGALLTTSLWLFRLPGSLGTPLMAVFLLVVIIAGYLLGSRGGYLFSAFSLLVFAIFFLRLRQVDPALAGLHSSSLELLGIWSLLILAAALLQSWFSASLLQAQDQARSQREALERSNQALLGIQENLERLIQERTTEIQRQKYFYQGLVDHLPLAVATLDSSGCLVACNPAFESLFQVQSAAVLGRQLDEVITNPATLLAAQELTRQVLAGRSLHTEGVRYRSDGTPLYVDIRGVPVTVEGQFAGILGIYHDISERVEAEKQRQAAEEARRLSDWRYRQTVLHSPNPIFTIDRQGLIQTWNPACAAVFQYGDEMLGQPYLGLVGEPDEQAHLAGLVGAVFESGASHQGVNLFYTCQDGTLRHMISRIYPLLGEDGQISGCVFANTDVTERNQIADALRRSELRLRSVIEQTQDGIAIIDEDGAILDWNPALENITGRTKAEVAGSLFWDVIYQASPAPQPDPDPPAGALFTWDELRRHDPRDWSNRLIEHEISRPDGSQLTLQSLVFPIQSEHDTMLGVFSRDITEQVQAIDRLQEFYQTIASVMDGLNVGVYCSELDTGRILLANRYLEQAYGPSLTGQLCYEVFFHRRTPCVNCRNHQLLDEQGSPLPGMVWEDYNPSNQRWYMLSDRAIRWPDGRYVRLEIAVDITGRKETEQRLEFLATHDLLTQLPNRVLFADRLQHAVLSAQRSGQKVAVVYIDLDDFKQVNDTCGHEAGDLVLCEAASRLKNCLRMEDLVARSGGDEFTLVLENFNEREEVVQTIQRIQHKMTAPFRVADRQFTLSASLGVSLYPDDDLTIDGLLNAADTAMYQAKQLGKNTCYFASGCTVYLAERTGTDNVSLKTAKGDEPQPTDGKSGAKS